MIYLHIKLRGKMGIVQQRARQFSIDQGKAMLREKRAVPHNGWLYTLLAWSLLIKIFGGHQGSGSGTKTQRHTALLCKRK